MDAPPRTALAHRTIGPDELKILTSGVKRENDQYYYQLHIPYTLRNVCTTPWNPVTVNEDMIVLTGHAPLAGTSVTVQTTHIG